MHEEIIFELFVKNSFFFANRAYDTGNSINQRMTFRNKIIQEQLK